MLTCTLRSLDEKSLELQLALVVETRTKTNYSVDSYFKDTLRAGQPKTDKAPKIPGAPKQIAMWVELIHGICTLSVV